MQKSTSQHKIRTSIASFLAVFWALSSQIAVAESIDVKTPQQKNLISTNGRFVFGQISEFRRDQYMLDTQTGRLWVMTVRTPPKNADGTQPPGEGIKFLDPVLYADSEGKLLNKNNLWNFTPPNN